MNTLAKEILAASESMRDALKELDYGEIPYVYHPLDYAWAMHEAYVGRFITGKRRVILMGMNPGPFGMAQTGVPFGEVAAVREWMKLEAPVNQPENMHPKRPVEGLDCSRSEVSGRRLWGLFSERFGKAETFFAEHFVLNYCPLLFLGETGRNLTPDKLTASLRAQIHEVCDAHLREVVRLLEPSFLVGVGAYAEGRMQEALGGDTEAVIAKVLHPSPASPAANRDWAGTATRQLKEAGVW